MNSSAAPHAAVVAPDDDKSTERPAGRPNGRHAVAYRASIPWFGRRIYIAFFTGDEQRSLQRVIADGQRRPWWHVTFSLSAVFLTLSTMLMAGVATLYLAKSFAGIDVSEGHFILHQLFFD